VKPSRLWGDTGPQVVLVHGTPIQRTKRRDMGFYEELLEERDEEERSGGRSSSGSEDIGSTAFASGPGSTFEGRYRDQRRADLRRMKSYLTLRVTNRLEAAHLATLKAKYPDEYWDLRYGRL
jgi:hypothetical protein